MSISMRVPAPEDLAAVAEELSTWQADGGPIQLHPGDLGWYSMRGPDRTAGALRLWTRDDTMVAVGLRDGPDLLRMAVAPDARDDDELASRMARDITDPSAGALGPGEAVVEARGTPSLTRALLDRGWEPGEPWTPLQHDLSQPVSADRITEAGTRIEVVEPDRAGAWCAVHWSAFTGSHFGETERREIVGWWLTMAEGPFRDRGRSLTALNPDGDAVAVTTVWSAGPGRPGLIEPMGVHRDHRGRGYGVAISVAAAAALQEMGASSAIVCAEGSNLGAVATYVGAGFTAQDPVADLVSPPR